MKWVQPLFSQIGGNKAESRIRLSEQGLEERAGGFKSEEWEDGMSGRSGLSPSFPKVEVKAGSPGVGVHQQRCFSHRAAGLVQSSAHQLSLRGLEFGKRSGPECLGLWLQG